MSLASIPSSFRGCASSPLTMYHQSTLCLFCSRHFRFNRLRYQFRERPHACCKRYMRYLLLRHTVINALGQVYFSCPKCARSVHEGGRLRRGWMGWTERVMDREEEQKSFCVSRWITVGGMVDGMGWVRKV